MSGAGQCRLFFMPEYRAYMIGQDGYFYESVPLDCADDAEAKEKAKQLVDGHDIELWERDCKVAAFNHGPGMQF